MIHVIDAQLVYRLNQHHRPKYDMDTKVSNRPAWTAVEKSDSGTYFSLFDGFAFCKKGEMLHV